MVPGRDGSTRKSARCMQRKYHDRLLRLALLPPRGGGRGVRRAASRTSEEIAASRTSVVLPTNGGSFPPATARTGRLTGLRAVAGFQVHAVLRMLH